MGSDVVDSACSICLEVVMEGGDGGRSFAKLRCGHGFHLDCIGSAFNAKGMMQCPNCRNVEKGNWLYGNGYCVSPSMNMDEWTHDDELYHLNFLEMPYTIRWCPVNRIGRVTSSFENGESFSSGSFQDLVGHHVITELPSISVPAQPCPHLSGFHQVLPASAPTFHASDGITQWNQVSDSTEVPSPSLRTNDTHYHDRDRYQSTHSHLRDITTASIQAPVSYMAPRSTRLEDGGPPSAGSPFHSFIGRHGSHASSLVLPHLSSSNRAPISTDPRRSLWPTSNHFGIYMYPTLPVSFNSSAGDMMSAGASLRRSRVQFLPFTSQTGLTESGIWTGLRRRNSTSVRQEAPARTENLIYWSSVVRSYVGRTNC